MENCKPIYTFKQLLYFKTTLGNASQVHTIVTIDVLDQNSQV
jgi:hypothetical protein